MSGGAAKTDTIIARHVDTADSSAQTDLSQLTEGYFEQVQIVREQVNAALRAIVLDEEFRGNISDYDSCRCSDSDSE